MTHPLDTVAYALDLHASGCSATEIERLTDVPRRTVIDWIAGRVPRRSLGPREALCPDCGAERHDPGQLPRAYVYLLGLYLGDGSIASHPRGVHKLRIMLDAAYPKIVDECAVAMGAVLPRNRVQRWPRPYGDIEVYSYSKSWPCLFPQHRPGKKHHRPIVLATWQERLVRDHPRLLLRGLIQSDGCRFQNTGRKWSHPRYGFYNFSPDIRAIFCRACEIGRAHV